MVNENPLTRLQNEVKAILQDLNKIDALEKKYYNPIHELSLTHTEKKSSC